MIDSDDEDEKDETLVGFISSHLTSEIDLFRDSLVNLNRGPEVIISLMWSCILLYNGWFMLFTLFDG